MKIALTTLGATLLLILAACGGDESEGEGEAEFLARVNAICANYGPKLALIPPPAELNDEWAAVGGDMGDLLEASVNELRLLEPPESLSKEYLDWLALRSEMAVAMREVQVAGELHSETAIGAGLERIDAAIAEADPLAEKLGFSECSPTGVRTAP